MKLSVILQIINNTSKSLFQRLDACYTELVIKGASNIFIYRRLNLVIISCTLNNQKLCYSIYL